MAARSKTSGRSAAWAISFAVHLIVLGAIALVPAQRLMSPLVVEVRLPPPPDYLRPDLSQVRKDAPAVAASALPRSAPPFAAPAPVSSNPSAEARPKPAAPTTAAAPPAGQPATAAPGPAAASPTAANPGISAAAVNGLRQSYGCSSSQRKTLTLVEQADCEARGAKRAENIPDRPYGTIPQYKKDYYDALAATQHAPNHIPGTDCVVNLELVASPQVGSGPATGEVVGVAINLRNPVVCVEKPGGGPKPKTPTLQDLGLAR